MASISRFPIVSLLALGMALPAAAQTPATEPAPQAEPQAPQAEPQAEPDQDRDVVVVTASKREETVQDIAVAVTAITSEMRDEIGLTTVQDYTNFAPGLSYSTSTDRLGMRGVTRTSNNFGIRSGISNYVDGVYFSSAIPASREPIFTERVEVVRGPQGTLYGRDSIGGALNVISKRPTDEFEGQFNIGGGDYGAMKVETTIAGPITDWLRYRVGGNRTAQQEGFLTNYSGLQTEGGRRDDYYVEGQLEGNIGDRFDWWVRAGSLAWNVRYGAPGARTGVGSRQPYDTRAPVFQSSADIGPNPWFGLSDPNRVQVGTQNTNPAITDRYGFNTDFSDFAKLSPTSELAAEAVWHADDFDIKYLGGYVYYNYNLQQDQDDSPIKQFTCLSALACGGVGRTIYTERVSDYTENRGWFSNEINFLSTWDGPLQVVSGIYQYQENYNQLVFTSNVTNPGGPVLELADLLNGNFTNPRPVLPTAQGRNAFSGSPIPGGSLVFFTNNAAINNAYGAFIQGDYKFNDEFKLTAGIRWSKDVMDGREYARVINHYVTQTQLIASGLFGPAAALLPPRIEVTSQLGGADPSTITATDPCGEAGRGVVNLGPASNNCADKTQFGIRVDPVSGNAYRDLEASWEEVTGVLGVDWTPDADTLVYGKYNRGYKPGGLGFADVFGVLGATPYTDKEIVDAVEVGFKRDWRDWNLITNAVLFYYDYQGYQVSNLIVPEDPDGAGPIPRPSPYTAYVNLPKTETTGFELETIWSPTDNLRLMLNYGYTNPEIKESPSMIHALDPFARDPAAQPLGAPAADGRQGQSLEGNILPFSPKNKIAVNAVYTWDFEDGSKIDLSGSYFWQDIAFSSVFNRSYTKIPSWTEGDARISWTSGNGAFTLIGFVRNLFDDIAYDSAGADDREGVDRNVAPTLCNSTPGTTQSFGSPPAQSCYTTNETLRPPRTVGAELQVKF